MNDFCRALLSCCALVALSCGSSDDSDPLAERELIPVEGCEHIDHAPCDILRTECQRSRLELAACLRGSDPGELPPVLVKTEAEFLEEGMLDDDSMTGVDKPDRFAQALSLLHIMEPEELDSTAATSASVRNIAGVYLDDTKEVVIIDHDEEIDARFANATLVHEFVHALQDRDVDLLGYREEFFAGVDATLAARSVVEGEARVHDSRFIASLFGLDPQEVDWTNRFEELPSVWLDAIVEETFAYSLGTQSFPHNFGPRVVYAEWESGNLDAVLGLFASPPRSSYAFMAVDREEPSPGAFSPPIVPDRWVAWEPMPEATLGAFSLLLLLTKTTEDVELARELALTWRGDRAFIYESSLEGVDETSSVWLLELDSEQSATRIHEQLLNLQGVGSGTQLFGNRVGITLSVRNF